MVAIPVALLFGVAAGAVNGLLVAYGIARVISQAFAEFRDGIAKALDYAAALNCPRLHVMAGLLPAGSTREGLRAGGRKSAQEAIIKCRKNAYKALNSLKNSPR